MERCRSNLEQKPGDQQARACKKHHVGGCIRHGLYKFRNPRNLRRPGNTVDQRYTVQQETGGKCTQEKVLESRFIRAGLATEKTGQDIQRNRQNFQTKEDGHQVGSRSHPHGACRCKQYQRIIFTDRISFSFQIFIRHENCQCRSNDTNHTEEGCKIIEHNTSGKSSLWVIPGRQGNKPGNNQCGDTQPGDMTGLAARRKHRHQQQRHTEHTENQ